MPRLHILAAIIVFIGVVAIPARAARNDATSGAATSARIYKNPAGDAQGGPDLRSLAISDRGGVIQFTYHVVGLKAPAAGDAIPIVVTSFDTNGDNSPEYWFTIEETPTETEWCFDSAATTKRCIPVLATTPFRASGNTYTMRIASSDLGGATAFSFWVNTLTFAKGGKTTYLDRSPNWSYTLKSVKLVLGTPVLRPTIPVAGKLFTITVPITRSDDAKLADGKGTRMDVPLPTVDGEAVIPKDLQMHFIDDAMSVSFTVPATATGKLLKLTLGAMSDPISLEDKGVTISVYNLNASRSFSFRVA